MIMLEWEIEHWQSGKALVSTISQLAIQRMEIQMLFRTLILLKILKVFGLMYITHTVSQPRKLLPSLSMERKILNQ
mgnify:CR=1 FL=1